MPDTHLSLCAALEDDAVLHPGSSLLQLLSLSSRLQQRLPASFACRRPPSDSLYEIWICFTGKYFYVATAIRHRRIIMAEEKESDCSALSGDVIRIQRSCDLEASSTPAVIVCVRPTGKEPSIWRLESEVILGLYSAMNDADESETGSNLFCTRWPFEFEPFRLCFFFRRRSRRRTSGLPSPIMLLSSICK